MPGLYNKNDFDLAGFAVGIVDYKDILGAKKVKVGDYILAVESSGVHSNGYSLIRKIVEQEQLNPNEIPHFSTQTWKQILLKPTILYDIVPFTSNIHALAHITGGGLIENLPRVIPNGLQAKIKYWDFPPLFQWIMEKTKLTTEQMLSTFNCGFGMIIITDNPVIECGLKVWNIGRVEEGNNRVILI